MDRLIAKKRPLLGLGLLITISNMDIRMITESSTQRNRYIHYVNEITAE